MFMLTRLLGAPTKDYRFGQMHNKSFWFEMKNFFKGSVHTIHFFDPIIFLVLFQLIDMFISITDLSEFE